MAIKVYFSEASAATDLEAIRAAGGVLADAGRVEPGFIDACLERERSYPTGMELADGSAVALPHGGQPFVKESSISVLRLARPVVFHRMDDDEQTVQCSLLFNLAIGTGGMQLDVLRRLMTLFQDAEFLAHCRQEQAAGLAEYISGRLGL